MVHCTTGSNAPTPALNALTTIAYYLKQNVDSPQLTSVLPLLGGKTFTADQLDVLLGVAFGLSNAGTAIPASNYVSNLLVRATFSLFAQSFFFLCSSGSASGCALVSMIDAHMGIRMLPEDLNPVICARNETSGLLQRVNCHETLMTGMCARKSESDL